MDAENAAYAANDPQTPQAVLADLAYEHPELRASIALNPSTYDGLLEWLAELGDPEIDAALEMRSRREVVDPDLHVVRVSELPHDSIDAGIVPLTTPAAVMSVEAGDREQEKRQLPGFITCRFVIVLSCIVVVGIAGAIIATSIAQANADARAKATFAAQEAAADKANKAADLRKSHSHPLATPSAQATPVPTPTPVQPVVPAGFVNSNFSYGWQEGFVAPGGYTEQVTVAVGFPEKVGSPYPTEVSSGKCETYETTDSGTCETYQTEAFRGGKYCDANSSTDAVIPMNLLVTDTTSGFKQVVGSSFTFDYYSDSDDEYLGMSRSLQYEGVYSDQGPQCEPEASGNFFSTTSLSEGGETALQMFLIVPNYYTPDHPNGDPDVLSEISLGLNGYSDAQVSWQSDGNPIKYQNSAGQVTSLTGQTSLQLGGS